MTLLVTLPSCASLDLSGPDIFQLQETVDEARLTFARFHGDPSMTWFRDLFPKAKGVLIVPSLTGAAYFIGGSWGQSILSVRNEDTGLWSEPAFYEVRAGSFGLQIGAGRGEMIVLVMTDEGVDSLVGGTLVLGTGVTIAVGPAGRGMGAGTTPSLSTDMVAFLRGRGAFAGVSLQGRAVLPHHEANEAYYGRPVDPGAVLRTNEVTTWYSERLRATLTRAAGDTWPLTEHVAGRR